MKKLLTQGEFIELFKYNYEAYLESCLAFAKDTTTWDNLPRSQHYTTDGHESWEESCDNAHGGLDVRWAFHRAEDYIKSTCLRQFYDEMTNLISLV